MLALTFSATSIIIAATPVGLALIALLAARWGPHRSPDEPSSQLPSVAHPEERKPDSSSQRT
jgi:hypothetical protein